MKPIPSVLILAVVGALAGDASAETVFSDTKQVIQKGDKTNEREIAFVVSNEKTLVLRHRSRKDEVYATIPFDAIKEMSYERSKSPRAKTAIFLSPLALMSPGKKHWLTIQYQVGDKKEFVLLHLDKGEYQRVIATLEAETGLEVEKIIES